MKDLTIWMKNPDIAVFIGGDPSKGQAPPVTLKLDNPQVLIDLKKNTITIIETK